MLLTGALFKIDQAAQYEHDNGDGTFTFVQSGREVHQGVEFGVSGRPVEGLTLWGGLTLMNAEYKKGDPTLVGKRPYGVADQLIKLTAEYDIAAVPGLTVTGGAYYTGPQYADMPNAISIASSVLTNAGFRYARSIGSVPMIFRLNATNIADRDYWVSRSSVGDPRSFAFSLETRF